MRKASNRSRSDRTSPSAVARSLEAICTRVRSEEERGSVATYIPELSHADPAKFGVAVALGSGEVIGAGDAILAIAPGIASIAV